jgi:hypothetical protein
MADQLARVADPEQRLIPVRAHARELGVTRGEDDHALGVLASVCEPCTGRSAEITAQEED